MLGLVPVGSAPLGVVSLESDSRLTWVNSDITSTGWTPNVGNNLYDAIDEISPTDADFIYSNVYQGTNIAVMGLSNSIVAGTYNINIRASKESPTAKLMISLGDSSSYKGSSGWIDITSSAFNLYTVSITTTGNCDRVKIESTV